MKRHIKKVSALVAAVIVVALSIAVPVSAFTEYPPNEHSAHYWFNADMMPYGGEYGPDGDENRNDVIVAYEYQVKSTIGTSEALNHYASGFYQFATRYHYANTDTGMYNFRVYSLYYTYTAPNGDSLDAPDYGWADISYSDIYKSPFQSDANLGAMYGDCVTSAGQDMTNGAEFSQTTAWLYQQAAFDNVRIQWQGCIGNDYDTPLDVLCLRWRDGTGQRYAYYIQLVSLTENEQNGNFCQPLLWSELTLFTNVYGKNAFGDYSAGYNAGYHEGYASGSLEGGLATEEQLAHAEKSGYNKGYIDGHVIGDREGYDRGYSQGLSDGDGIKLDYSTPAASFSSMITGFLTGIGNIITPFLDVEIFGINLKTGIGTLVCLAAIGGLLCVILKVVK